MLYVWAILSGSLAVACEILFKTTRSYWSLAAVFLPLAVAINYSVFRLVREAQSLPAAFVVFSFVTLAARTAASIWLGDVISPGTWAGIALLTIAVVVRHLWP